MSDLSVDMPILPQGFSSHDVASMCRRAFMAFCRGEIQGWEKIDLVRWLAGPYANVAALVLDEAWMAAMEQEEQAEREGKASSRTPTGVSLPLSADVIQGLLAPAWQRTTRLIESLAYGGGVGAIDEAFSNGSLTEARVMDTGLTVFVPIHRPRLTLAQRVQSLVIADYLVLPEAYRGDVMPCEACGGILLGEARNHGRCLDHFRDSAIRPGLANQEAHEIPAPADTARDVG